MKPCDRGTVDGCSGPGKAMSSFITLGWRPAPNHRRAGGNLSDQYNLDTFLLAASAMLDDTRYETVGSAPLRAMATTFQGELSAWLSSVGGAVMGRGFTAVRTPMVLTAIAERIADRLGLYRPESLDGLAALEGQQREAYAGFCRRCLFDTGAGRPVFPMVMREPLVSGFAAGLAAEIAGAANGLEIARAGFTALFDPYAPPDAVTELHSGGLIGLYRRALAMNAADTGYWFAGDFTGLYAVVSKYIGMAHGVGMLMTTRR